MSVFCSGTRINRWNQLTAQTNSVKKNKNKSTRLIKSDPPELHVSGRMAGTGTAVAGMGTREVGCQLRWRFLGGPDAIEDAARKSRYRIENVFYHQDNHFILYFDQMHIS